MAILERIRPYQFPVLGHVTMNRTERKHRARMRQWAELELMRSGRRPRTASSVAVDAHADTTISAEGDRVLRFVIQRQCLVVAALELHELPGRATEVVFCLRMRQGCFGCSMVAARLGL